MPKVEKQTYYVKKEIPKDSYSTSIGELIREDMARLIGKEIVKDFAISSEGPNLEHVISIRITVIE